MKFYDLFTWLICCNIMGALAVNIFPLTGTMGAYGATAFSESMSWGLVAGIIGSLIIAAAASFLFPGGERTVVYAFFGFTFIFFWTSLTSVINSIQIQIKSTGFPLAPIILGIGMVLMLVTMFRFAGAELEN